MAQNKKPKSVAQLKRENKQLTEQLADAQEEVETSAGKSETIRLLQNERYENWCKINELQRQIVTAKNETLPVRRALVLNIAAELANVAKQSGIPAILFIDNGEGCTLFNTATAGQAIDMYSNIARHNAQAGTVMGHALSLADSLDAIAEN